MRILIPAVCLQIKCDQYWPLGADVGDSDEYVFESCNLKVRLGEETHMSYYITRVLQLTDLKVRDGVHPLLAILSGVFGISCVRYYRLPPQAIISYVTLYPYVTVV